MSTCSYFFISFILFFFFENFIYFLVYFLADRPVVPGDGKEKRKNRLPEPQLVLDFRLILLENHGSGNKPGNKIFKKNKKE
jgi:hypothetical protein